MKSIGFSLCFGTLLAWCAAPGCLLAAGGEFEIIQLEKVDTGGAPVGPGEDGHWRVTWCSEADMEYRVWRSTNLIDWFEVATVESTTTETGVTDFADPPPPGTRLFWKVELLGPAGEPLDVSDIVASYDLNGVTSSALFSLVTSGSSPIQSVIFYDDGVALGNASRGPGNVWTFSVDWDQDAPEARAIEAEVTNEDGDMVQTPLVRFLLADPTRYVPLDGSGNPLYGEFIPMDASGNLGAFAYYPEGIGDLNRTTGAHFVFPAGTSFAAVPPPPAEPIEGLPPPPPAGAMLQFSNATFHRGHADENPVQVTGGSRSLNLDSVDSASVATAFDLSDVELCWGGNCVSWEGGTLGEAGWSTLQVDLGLGEFGLPDSRLDARIGFDPITEIPYLIVCYHGTWTPVQNTTFSIPEGNPLKIYLSTTGDFSASGTAEATFPNGAKVSGSLAWRDPVFEFRFEGKSLTIPALNSLRTLMPGSVETLVPGGITATELDQFAERLGDFHTLTRAVSNGAASLVEGANELTGGVLPGPSDQMGSSLEAWGARLSSWTADRSGQVLNTTQIEELRTLIANSADVVSGVSDLPSALRLLLHITRISQSMDAALTTSPAAIELAEEVERALANAEAAAARIVEGTPVFEFNETFRDSWKHFIQIVEELNQAAPPPPPATAGLLMPPPPPNPAAGCLAIFSEAADRLDATAAFAGRGIVENQTDGTANPQLIALYDESFESVQVYQQDLRLFLDYFTCHIPGTHLQNLPTGILIREAMLQNRSLLIDRHNSEVAAAIASMDYSELQVLLKRRVRIIEAFRDIDGGPGLSVAVSSGDFAISNLALVTTFEGALEQRLFGTDHSQRRGVYRDAIALMNRFASESGDPQLNPILRATTDRLSHLNAGRSLASLGIGCDALISELEKRKFQIPSLPDNFETDHSIPVTGKYESMNTPRGAVHSTLQINQAGQYITGHLQTHRAPGGDRRIRGLYLSGNAATGNLKFALLRLHPTSGAVTGAAELTATMVNGLPRVVLKDKATGVSTTFELITNFPSLPPATPELFAGEQRDVLRAQQRMPLHSEELAHVGELFEQAKVRIRQFTDVNINSVEAQLRASQLDDVIEEMLNGIDSDSIPLVRLRLFQSLSRETRTAGGIARTLRDRMIIMLARYPAQLSHLETLLNGVGTKTVPSSGGLYTYAVTVRQLAITASAAKIFGIGAVELDIEIVKTGPNGENYQPFVYDGFIGQAGIAVPLPEKASLPGGVTVSYSNVEIKSPFNYSAEDLEGPILMHALGAQAAAVGGVSIADSALTLVGKATLPPLVVDTGSPPTDPGFVSGLVLGAGFDLGAGLMVIENPSYDDVDDLTITRDLLNYTLASQSDFNGSFGFTLGSSALAPCGRQYLREMVAENRALFANPDSKVVVLGFTDSTGSDATNLTLSQGRADAIKTAILEMLGPNLALPAANIYAAGFGEDPCRTDRQTPTSNPTDASEPTDPAWMDVVPDDFKHTVRTTKDLAPRISDTAPPDAAWRRVVIAVNGVFVVDMKSPTPTAP